MSERKGMKEELKAEFKAIESLHELANLPEIEAFHRAGEIYYAKAKKYERQYCQSILQDDYEFAVTLINGVKCISYVNSGLSEIHAETQVKNIYHCMFYLQFLVDILEAKQYVTIQLFENLEKIVAALKKEIVRDVREKYRV